ncbi:chaplin [Streptomyces cavernae]|uniref:chaplin n=1 Tax=Streptomyces cavernae TaxID=2259034 RepID=UPI000FEBDD99
MGRRDGTVTRTAHSRSRGRGRPPATVSARQGTDETAAGGPTGSPGPIAATPSKLPLEVPVGLCGNTGKTAGALSPAAGNRCPTVQDRSRPYG